MFEMYWITRLDDIRMTIMIALIVLVFFVAFVAGIHFIESDEVKEVKAKLKPLKLPAIIVCILACVLTFIPNTKDVLLIYGVGSSIEYVKSNDEAKKLPDKAIRALDKYLDEMTDKNNKK